MIIGQVKYATNTDGLALITPNLMQLTATHLSPLPWLFSMLINGWLDILERESHSNAI